jgi:hypothetical protein
MCPSFSYNCNKSVLVNKMNYYVLCVHRTMLYRDNKSVCEIIQFLCSELVHIVPSSHALLLVTQNRLGSTVS